MKNDFIIDDKFHSKTKEIFKIFKKSVELNFEKRFSYYKNEGLTKIANFLSATTIFYGSDEDKEFVINMITEDIISMMPDNKIEKSLGKKRKFTEFDEINKKNWIIKIILKKYSKCLTTILN